MSTATPATAAALAVEYADRLVTRTVRDVHRSIGGAAFRAVGPAAAPVRLAHDGVSALVYGILSGSAIAIGGGLRHVGREGRDLQSSSRGRFLVAAVNGLVGESLHQQRDPMAISMAARVDGGDVTDLAAAYPHASGDVVIFVHGLCESEDAWLYDAAATGGSYADRLAAETSWTPVLMRYNTGRPVRRNGELLSAWLEQLVDDWPVDVRRIALVGHSMGGLVALAAVRTGGCWTEWLRHVVCLGTPHLGAPLEQAAHHGARLLRRFDASRPFATILDTRSPGIVDLRRGSSTWEAEWADAADLPTHAAYHCISGSLPGPLGVLVGDLMVRRRSATGRIPSATRRHLPGAHHLRLLNHPEVYADLRRLLG